MKRTAHRPLPTGQVSLAEAVAFSSACGSLGLGVLYIGASPCTAAIAAATMATYIGAYTPMKTRSPYNTHIGAISGSLPTLMGFSAVYGAGFLTSPWGAGALWLFGLQTLWQMPHFYALAWIYRSDYIRGGYDMFPLTDATGHATAAMSKPYLAALCLMPWGLAAGGLATWMLPIGALAPSALWWHALRRFEKKPSKATCRRFFLGSLSYLVAMLALFTVYAKPAERPGAQAPGSARREEGEEAIVDHDGPQWRNSVKAAFAELCPHEKVYTTSFGLGRTGCPF